jgi:hypothetical protein
MRVDDVASNIWPALTGGNGAADPTTQSVPEGGPSKADRLRDMARRFTPKPVSKAPHFSA